MWIYVCICRKSACNGSDGEKKDGNDLDDSIAMAADLHEVTAAQYEFVFHALCYVSAITIHTLR